MKNLPWLVTISSGLGDSIQALVAIKQIICKAEQHPVFLVCDKHLYPLFSDLEGPTKIFSFQLDLNKIKNFQYDWVIDFASIDWSFNLCKDLVYFHYARHEFYSKPILEGSSCIMVDGEFFPAKFFDPSGTGISSNPSLPAWLLEMQLVSIIFKEDISNIDYSTEPQLNFISDPEIFIKSHPVKNSILLAPCGSDHGKRWPEPNWCELSELLIKNGFPVSVILGPWEKEHCKNLIFPKEVVCLDELNSRELAACVSLAKFVISNDCGPMHVSGALNRPTLAIFGPTNPICWFTYSGAHRQFLRCTKGPDPYTWGKLNPEKKWEYWPTVIDVFNKFSNCLQNFSNVEL